MSKVRCLGFVVCLSLSLSTGNALTGRCCLSVKDIGDSSSDGGVSKCSGSAGDFQPPVTTNTTVTWKPYDLTCSPTNSIAYYDLTNDTNLLLSMNDDINLAYQIGNLFPKITNEYCVEAHGQGYRGARCKPDPEKLCDGAVCIPKCCSEGEIVLDYQCTKGDGNLSLQFYSFHGKPVSTPPNVVAVAERSPICSEGFPGFKQDVSNLHLLVNGKLLEQDVGTHEFDHYCIEDMVIDNVHTLLFLTCAENDPLAIVVKHYLQLGAYILSIVFLAVAIACHALIPSLQDTQGLCFLSHMVAMIVTNIFLLILSVSNNISAGLCIFSGFILQYFFLAMFFWLNIMCFDIWKVIRATVKAIPLNSILGNDGKMFRRYSMYGWGSPLLVTVVTLVMHWLPEEHTVDFVLPNFGKETCWLSGDMEMLAYCYAYVAILFILDLGFVGHSIYMLLQAGSAFMCFKKQVFVTAFNRKHLDSFWQRFILFILMVLCWMTEILSWKIPPPELWIVTDVLNSLQGFLVFLIFISNKKRRHMVLKLLRKIPLPCLKNRETSLTPDGVIMATIRSPSASVTGSNATELEISQEMNSDVQMKEGK